MAITVADSVNLTTFFLKINIHILFNYIHGVMLDRVFRFPLRKALLDDRMGTDGVFFLTGVVLALTGVAFFVGLFFDNGFFVGLLVFVLISSFL